MGIRVLKGEQTGYGYTNDLSPESMERAAKTAAAIASSTSHSQSIDLTVANPKHNYYKIQEDLSSQSLKDKIQMVRDFWNLVSPTPDK